MSAEEVVPAQTVYMARAMLSNRGGTPPTWKAVVKAARRLHRGLKITGSWRDWPTEKYVKIGA